MTHISIRRMAERALTIRLESELLKTDRGFEVNLAGNGLAIRRRSEGRDYALLVCFDLPA